MACTSRDSPQPQKRKNINDALDDKQRQIVKFNPTSNERVEFNSYEVPLFAL